VGPGDGEDNVIEPAAGVAIAWLDGIYAEAEGGWERAWALSHPQLQLCMAQQWLWQNRTLPIFAGQDLEGLAELWRQGDGRSLSWAELAWEEFGHGTVLHLRDAWESNGHWQT
jgi:hypothetical protein